MRKITFLLVAFLMSLSTVNAQETTEKGYMGPFDGDSVDVSTFTSFGLSLKNDSFFTAVVLNEDDFKNYKNWDFVGVRFYLNNDPEYVNPKIESVGIYGYVNGDKTGYLVPILTKENPDTTRDAKGWSNVTFENSKIVDTDKYTTFVLGYTYPSAPKTYPMMMTKLGGSHIWLNNAMGTIQNWGSDYGNLCIQAIVMKKATTAIKGIKSTNTSVNENAPIYNLAGQRVGNDYHGIVIQNGKKFLKR